MAISKLKSYTIKSFNNGQAPSIDKEFLEGAEKTSELTGLQIPIQQLVNKANELVQGNINTTLTIAVINAILESMITSVGEKLIVTNAFNVMPIQLGPEYWAVNPYGRYEGKEIGNDSTALGDRTEATKDGCTAIGFGAMATGANSVAIGTAYVKPGYQPFRVRAVGDRSLAIGTGAWAANSESIAIGLEATTFLALRGIAIGSMSIALGEEGIAIGYSARIEGTGFNSMAIGSTALTNGTKSIAIGYGAKAIGDNTISIGNSSGTEYARNNTITLGNGDITALRCQVQTILELSDERVKENIELANTSICLNDVLRLPVSRFKYKKFTGTHLDEHRTGFLASDVQKVFPKSVQENDEEFPVLDEEGNKQYETVELEDGSVKQKLKTFKMEKVKTIAMEMAIPTLWGAIQEQQNIINELKNRVDNLTQEIETFKNK